MGLQWVDRLFSLFVGGSPSGTAPYDIQDVFSRFSRVINVFIPASGGRVRSFAFVQFKKFDEVQRIFSSLFVKGMRAFVSVVECWKGNRSSFSHVRKEGFASGRSRQGDRSYRDVVVSGSVECRWRMGAGSSGRPL